MNFRSLTQAIGWRGLFSMFGGEGSKPQSLASFLPFPDEFDSGKKPLSNATLETLRKLIRENRLNHKAISAAISLDSSLEAELENMPIASISIEEMLLLG